MAGPAWCLWVLAAAMLAVTLHGLGQLVGCLRLRSRRLPARCSTSAALLQVLMGTGMLVMLLPTTGGGPRPVWGAGFALIAAWTGAAAHRRSRSIVERPGTGTHGEHRLRWHHSASSAVMAYMFLAARPHGANQAAPHPTPAAQPIDLAPHAHGVAESNVTGVLEHGHPGMALPLLAWLLMVHSALRAGYLFGDFVNSGRTRFGASTDSPVSSPGGMLAALRLDITTEIVMALGTSYMLLIML